jgi:hypothetical protein
MGGTAQGYTPEYVRNCLSKIRHKPGDERGKMLTPTPGRGSPGGALTNYAKAVLRSGAVLPVDDPDAVIAAAHRATLDRLTRELLDDAGPVYRERMMPRSDDPSSFDATGVLDGHGPLSGRRIAAAEDLGLQRLQLDGETMWIAST